MPPGATAEARRVVRNGLAVLLAAVVATGLLAGGGRTGPPSRRAGGRSTWLPPLRAASRVEGREPAAAVLMRGGRLPIASLSADDFRLIDGIGPQRARALIAARRAGGLGSLADVDRLPGFGPQLASRLASSVVFANGMEER